MAGDCRAELDGDSNAAVTSGTKIADGNAIRAARSIAAYLFARTRAHALFVDTISVITTQSMLIRRLLFASGQ
jgi:archaeosine-15-forming tRNA-guanine transglycosylase